MSQNEFRSGIHGTRMLWRLLSSQSEMEKEIVRLNPETQDAPYQLTDAQEKFVIEGVERGREKLMEMSLEMYVKRDKGNLLPETITLDSLKVMLSLTATRRKSFLTYLCMKEMSRKAKSMEQATKQTREWVESTSEHPWLDTGVHRNCLFIRILKQDKNQVYNSNTFSGLQFGQKIVVDCSYNDYMDEIAMKKTALQILKCFYSVRSNRRPFSLHLCNLDFNGRLMFYLNKHHPGFIDNAPIGLHTGSYLELFKRENLVYLSPHSHHQLKYNPNDTYILGGYVDTSPLAANRISVKKATAEKIRHAALPLDKYLKWLKGSKNLCVHHCLDILLDVKNTGDWYRALKTHVPARRLKPEEK